MQLHLALLLHLWQEGLQPLFQEEGLDLVVPGGDGHTPTFPVSAGKQDYGGNLAMQLVPPATDYTANGGKAPNSAALSPRDSLPPRVAFGQIQPPVI